MDARGLISVLVAVYNTVDLVPRCVESIMSQSYEDLEIILVDDGSEDGSGEICDEYARKDKRIKVIHKNNGGLAAARNTGLRAARGKYIGFVDGDDFIQPDMYESLLKGLLAHKAQMAVCTYRQIGEGAKNRRTTGEVVALSMQEALEIYICGHPQYKIFPSVWSKLFVREAIEGLEFDVNQCPEDIIFTTKAFFRIEQCVYLDAPYYNYIVNRKGSLMNRKIGNRRFESELPLWREQIKYLQDRGLAELAEKAYYHFYRRMLFYYIEFRELKEKDFARRMAAMLKSEKTKINVIYRNRWVARGDWARIKMMLAWPGLYYWLVMLYDKYLIPLRQSGQKK